jgi:hypothetical protein
VFRGANKQKHLFKKNPKALIWGKPPKVVGGKLLISGYWYATGISRNLCMSLFSLYFLNTSFLDMFDCFPECKITSFLFVVYRGIARHCNYLGDLLLALSFSLPCGAR